MNLFIRIVIGTVVMVIAGALILGYDGYHKVNLIEMREISSEHDDVWSLSYNTGDGTRRESSDKLEISNMAGLKRYRFSVPGIADNDFAIQVSGGEGWLKFGSISLSHYFGSRKVRLRLRTFDADELSKRLDRSAPGIGEAKVNDGVLSIHLLGRDGMTQSATKVELSFSKLEGVRDARTEHVLWALKTALLSVVLLAGVFFVFYPLIAATYRRLFSPIAQRFAARYSVADIVLYFVIVLSCYVTFQQADLVYTGGSSIAYLSGHFRDFYEYNTRIFKYVNYLPSTYLLFAFWNLPLKVLGILTEPTLDVGYCYLWFKLLTTLFFFASALLVRKLGNRLGLSDTMSRSMVFVYCSSPILIFSQFIFGQYDIFTVYFVLLGILLLLQRRMLASAVVFGIAFTFKYFALLVYLPMLFSMEKRPARILQCLLVALLPFLVNVLPYIGSSAFREGVFGFTATDRVFISSIEIFPGVGAKISLFIVSWIVLCGIAYGRKNLSDQLDQGAWMLYVGMVAACLTFGLVFWHPQWVLFLVPFLVITTFLTGGVSNYLILDFLMMIPFVGISVTLFPMNVDQEMFSRGVLARFNPRLFDSDTAFRMKSFFNLTSQPTTLYYSIFAGCLTLNALLKYPKAGRAMAMKTKGNGELQPYHWHARLRFFGGVFVFLLPAFASYFISLLA